MFIALDEVFLVLLGCPCTSTRECDGNSSVTWIDSDLAPLMVFRGQTPGLASLAGVLFPRCLWVLSENPRVCWSAVATPRFETDYAEYVEGTKLVNVVVVREGGFSGDITVSYQILPGTTANLGTVEVEFSFFLF